VRDPAWQRDFLSRPLAQRKAIGSDLRRQSEERKASGVDYAEVDAAAASAWLDAADAQVMIHGHTHRPADHALDAGHTRTVLSDWDSRARPPRQQVLRLTSAGLQRVAFA
jgi:UDP-2,3-diacylglucosamine hydrolase